jgi:hypothetical protein
MLDDIQRRVFNQWARSLGHRHSSASASTDAESMPETRKIVHLTTQTTPANWSTRSMTARAGVGDDTALPRNSR